MKLRILGAAVVALVMGAWAGEAQAEIVFLTSGRSVSVKGHRVDGDRIILSLRTGGEVTCDRSLIDKILPDLSSGKAVMLRLNIVFKDSLHHFIRASVTHDQKDGAWMCAEIGSCGLGKK